MKWYCRIPLKFAWILSMSIALGTACVLFLCLVLIIASLFDPPQLHPPTAKDFWQMFIPFITSSLTLWATNWLRIKHLDKE